MRERMRQNNVARERATLKDKILQELDDYFELCFDPEKELKDQFGRLARENNDVDWEKVRGFDTLYISRHFDLAEWWKSKGKGLFPHVAVAVPSIMAIPASNAHQERTFSACTHFDDGLRSRLDAEKFEMAVLVAINKAMTKIEVPTSNETKTIASKEVACVTASKSDAVGAPEEDRVIVSPRNLFGEPETVEQVSD
jgi:hypothetical protein